MLIKFGEKEAEIFYEQKIRLEQIRFHIYFVLSDRDGDYQHATTNWVHSRILFQEIRCSTAICLDIDGRVGARGKELGVDLAAHESGTNRRAANEVDPDGSPTKLILQGTNGQETDRGRDGTASVDETRDGTQGFVVSTNRRVRGQVSSDGRCNNVVGSASRCG